MKLPHRIIVTPEETVTHAQSTRLMYSGCEFRVSNGRVDIDLIDRKELTIPLAVLKEFIAAHEKDQSK